MMLTKEPTYRINCYLCIIEIEITINLKTKDYEYI
nr:MAG TPA: hypothetical protein [Caudoviricetes sp.]